MRRDLCESAVLAIYPGIGNQYDINVSCAHIGTWFLTAGLFIKQNPIEWKTSTSGVRFTFILKGLPASQPAS